MSKRLPTNQLKHCPRCQEDKPIGEFAQYTGGKERWICKDCFKKYRKNARSEYRETHGNKKFIKSSYTHKYSDLQRYLFKKAKSRAKKYNLEFDLILEDIVIPEYCPIFKTKIIGKIEFDGLGGKGRNYNGPSMDRIENHKGYIKSNIVICSWKANYFKGMMSYKEIKAWYKFMKKHLGK